MTCTFVMKYTFVCTSGPPPPTPCPPNPVFGCQGRAATLTSFVTTAEYCNIMHADGAGTKSSLAYMYWKETGDVSVWRGIAQDAIIMNLDDLLCVGATDNILLSSTIGRNKNLIPGPVVSALISGTEEVLQMLRDNDVNIVSTGGETADVGDLVRTVIVDSTVTCRCCMCLAV